ncbi:hypothetical protein HHE02_05030 [Helicobacter heilmannii]|nr:hypothetical protein HHE02_05030 [Helicobacter heilmannii]
MVWDFRDFQGVKTMAPSVVIFYLNSPYKLRQHFIDFWQKWFNIFLFTSLLGYHFTHF